MSGKAQERVFSWVCSTFGEEHALNVPERALRHAEEALELAQACGLDAATLRKLVDYVFERPVGNAGQEIAGSMVTLYSVAASLDVDAEGEFEREMKRVNEPAVIERCQRRQAEKREALGHPGKP